MANDRNFYFTGANVTFNDIHDNDVVNVSSPGAVDLSKTIESPTANPNAPQDALTEFENCLKYEYYKRYPQNYNAAIAKIKSSTWNDKDHARVALAFFESAIMSSKKPATFLPWYRIYCSAFNVQFHEEYTPSHLNDSKVSLDFKKYLVVTPE